MVLRSPLPIVAALGLLALVAVCRAEPAEPSAAASSTDEPAATSRTADPGARTVKVDELVSGMASLLDPTQTYTLYLPAGYRTDRRYPALLIFDPRGRSRLAAELFLAGAREHGWILISSDQTRSDGPLEPNVKALQALWPEVHGRFATDPRRIYAAGFSGGAMLAYSLGQSIGGLAGVIGAGGRFEGPHYDRPMTFACYGAAGDADFNYAPMHRVHETLRGWQTPQRLDLFHGPHSWMPPELAQAGIDWLEIQAMRSGLRPRDGALAASLLARELAAGEALEAAGDLLWALGRYRAARQAFDGLTDLAEVDARVGRLEATPAVMEALAAEGRAAAWEAAELPRLEEVARQQLAASPLLSRRVLSALGAPTLLRKADAGGLEAAAVRRVLESLATKIGFYQTQGLLERGEYAAAMPYLEIAVGLAPRNPFRWYNLACVQARAGSKRAAFESLERAIEVGFGQRQLMESDEDLASLRDDPRFATLLARLPAPPTAP